MGNIVAGNQFINPLTNHVKVVIFAANDIIISNFLKKKIDANIFLIFVYFTDQNFDDLVSSENNT